VQQNNEKNHELNTCRYYIWWVINQLSMNESFKVAEVIF